MTVSKGSEMEFREIEHKFVVPESFDVDSFRQKVRDLQPEREYRTEVTDTYYLLEAVPHLVYRHRFDGMIQQLTCKSVSSHDSESRLEINLHLDLQDQSANIEAFLFPFGIQWSGILRKKVHVFYFRDIEIVFYQASYMGSAVSCIELESRRPESLASAQKTLELWELRLGLIPAERSHLSLLHLLVLKTLPDYLRAKIANM